MDKIKEGKKNSLIRVSPTISPNAALDKIKKPNMFFIRPEDLQLYSPIDVIDFREPNQETEDALYSIYKRGTFNFNLNELVKNLNNDTNNLFIQEDFAKMRRNCGQRCKTPGYMCRYCECYFNILHYSFDLLEKK